MLGVKVGGLDLKVMGPYEGITMSHTWPHGSEELSWRMRPGQFHSALVGGARVEGFDGGIRVWRGRLSEPASNGQFSANGAWSELDGFYALDGSGNATRVPDTAIDTAISKGLAVTRPASLSAVSWGTTATTGDQPLKLPELLDQAMASLGKRPYIDADGAIRAAVDPTTPAFHVPHAAVGHGLTLAEDEYFSHLLGYYIGAGPVFATVSVGDAAAATRWGYKEEPVNLHDMGIISGATATAHLTALLALVGARMGFAESLELGKGEITTPGGTAVELSMPLACTREGGQMVRLQGVTDRTRATGSSPNTDIVISRSVYTDGAATATFTPLGKASRDLRELIGGR